MVRAVKVSGWLLMLLLALVIGLVSLRYFFVRMEAATEPQFVETFARHLPMFLIHVGGGVLSLILGPWQFWSRLRNRSLSLHRWLGRLYLLAIFAGGLAGLGLAFISFGGPVAHAGFAALAAGWLVTGFMAYIRIRQGKVEAHRAWMIRSYALTFGAVTLRLWLPLLMAMGLEYPEAYVTVAWLSWVPNLAAAELYLRINIRRVHSPDTPAAFSG